MTSDPYTIDRLQPEHVHAAAALIALCAGGSATWRALRLRKLLAGNVERDWACVAIHQGCVIGEARATYFMPPPESPCNVAPEGWYLLGLNVHPDYRRRGIGTLLSRYRLDWLRERAREVWYFTNVLNHASAALHGQLGFDEVTDDFWFPRTTFGGGKGVLYRLPISPSLGP